MRRREVQQAQAHRGKGCWLCHFTATAPSAFEERVMAQTANVAVVGPAGAGQEVDLLIGKDQLVAFAAVPEEGSVVATGVAAAELEHEITRLLAADIDDPLSADGIGNGSVASASVDLVSQGQEEHGQFEAFFHSIAEPSSQGKKLLHNAQLPAVTAHIPEPASCIDDHLAYAFIPGWQWKHLEFSGSRIKQ